MYKDIEIGNIKLGKNFKTFIVAELSANHNNKFEIAVKTIKAAKEAGADAIKIQTYTPDTITLNCKNDLFKIKQGTIWDGKYLYDLYNEAYTPWEWHDELKKTAEQAGLIFFSTPFDFSSVDFLEKMNVPLYKIASFEITDIPLIEYVAKKQKPIIISTGIAMLEDIELAIETCRKVGNEQIALLKCTSSYPAPIEASNLNTIPDMIQRFGLIVGLSDHTIGDTVAITSVALGAKIIEKHFILDRKMGGADSTFSMEPQEFKKMVKSVREVESALGEIDYSLTEESKKSRNLSRSLFVVKEISKGDIFTRENIRSIRPGYGLHPKYFFKVLGKTAKLNINAGTPLEMNMINI
jgi:pseudaminic acid synthase